MNYWPTIAKKVPKVIRQFAGVNKGDPLAINEAFFPNAVNRTIDDRGST